MSAAAKTSAPSPRATEHASSPRKVDAPKAASTPDVAAAQAVSGNQALQRLVGMDRAHAMSQVTPPDDPSERAADRLAARGGPVRNTPTSDSSVRAVHAAGASLDPALRAGMERHFGASLHGVRVHAGNEAARAAHALNARAFTYGRDIVFGAGQYAPHTRSGRSLLAHELAHVLLPSARAPLMRQPAGPDKQPGTDSGAGGQKAQDPDVKDEYVFVVDVPNPSLDPHKRARDEDKQQIAIHTPKDGAPLNLHFYIVPVTKLKPPATAAAPAKPAPAAPPPAPAATPNAPPAVPSNESFPPGSKATTIDGSKVLEVLASTPEHIITGEYVKFAVGAASTSAVKLADGTAMIIDAGINADNMGMTEKALSKLTIDKLAEFLGERPIREFLISHAHGDHISLAPDIIRRFPVDTIRINSVQTRWSGYKEARKELVEQQEARLKETFDKFKVDMEAERAKWTEETGRKFAEDQRQIEWEKHVESEFKARAETNPAFRRARERVLVQAKTNVLDVREFDLVPGRQVSGDPKADPERVEFKADDPYRIYETQGPIKNKDVLDQRKNVDDSKVDPNASSYVVDLPNGRRLIVAPDLRANNLKKLMARFESMLAELNKNNKGTPITVQQWDISHHMQKGWTGSAVTASQFSKIVDFLGKFALKKGSDFVVVSAEANLSNPNAPTLVDPANVWLLRSLGFEVFLATSGRDIRVIDIRTSQGNQVTGIIGTRAPGEGPPELSIRRAKMALDQINAELQAQRLAKPDSGSKKKKKGKKAEPESPPTDEEIAAEKAREARVKELETLRDTINKAYKEALAEITELSKPPAGSKTHTTKSLDDVTKREFPKQKALDELLEKHNFDKPQTTDLRLTEMALVVLKQDIGAEPPAPGTAAARAYELAQSRSRVLELEAIIKSSETITPEMQIELVAELTRYRKIIENELNPADPKQALLEGTSRTVLSDELTTTTAKLEKLGAAESQTQFKRDVESGILAEQEIIVLKPPTEQPKPSKGVETTGQVLEGFGRGMGVVMVVTTVRGQVDLIERLKNKKANLQEGVLGTVHNVAAGVVAVRMVRGMHVGLGAMAALAVLDIATVASRDYNTEEERNIEIAYSAISNSINLGLMAAGMAIARIPHPVTMIAGTLIAFAGPWILEKLGVHAWLERKLEFNPASVTQVKQTLRDLMVKYKTIIGSIELSKRTADASDSAVVGDRAAMKAEALKTVHDQRLEAAKLEREIMDEFDTAYQDARVEHSGLKDLDTYRAWFMSLRFRAGLDDTTVLDQLEQENIKAHADPDDPNKAPPPRLILIPDEVDSRFAEMDRKLQINVMATDTPDNIDAMKLWDKLDSELDDLQEIVDNSKDDEYEKKYSEHQRKVQAIIDNAYYRLDPRGQGTYRSKPLIQETPVRDMYLQKLQEKQARYLRIQHVHVVNLRARTGTELAGPDLIDADKSLPTVGIDAVMQMLENALSSYGSEIESGENPSPELAKSIVTDSAGAANYRTFIMTHPGFAAKLKRLQVDSEVVDSLFDQAKYMIAAGTDAAEQKKQRERYNKAELNRRVVESVRMDKLGIYFDSELDAISSAALKREIEKVAPLFGDQAKIRPLSEEELTALIKHEEYGGPGVNFLPPLATRLSKIEGGLGVDRYGNINNIFRLTGAVDLMVPGGVIHRTFPWPIATSEMNALVGGVRSAGRRVDMNGVESDWMTIVPLNDAAIRFCGGYSAWDTSINNLLPMNVELLEYKRDHPGQ